MNKDSQAVNEGWPEDRADWPQTASVVQGGLAPIGQQTVDERLANLQEQQGELLSAAKALIERWDSPLWKDLPPTANAIARLRNAVAKAEGGAI